MKDQLIQRSLKPLIDSQGGVHLTAYIPKPKSTQQARGYILEVEMLAQKYLEGAMTSSEFSEFMKPISLALREQNILENIQGNLGIFRSKSVLRLISVPVPVELNCYVANSFHIKPLIRWIQNDREFFLMGFSTTSMHFYQGNQNTFRHVLTIPYSPNLLRHISNKQNHLQIVEGKKRKPKNLSKNQNESARKAIQDLVGRIQLLGLNSKASIFLAGSSQMCGLVRRYAEELSLYPEDLRSEFDPSFVAPITKKIRALQRLEATIALDRSLTEFDLAYQSKRTKHDLFQIAKSAVQGKVSKLVVSDEIEIFGKLDTKTGALRIHASDLDHEDDDLLDDIAQTVLSFGGEVFVAKSSAIPTGKPILAIVDHETNESKLRFQNKDELNQQHEQDFAAI